VPETADEWLAHRRGEIDSLAKSADDPAWWGQQIESLPRSYLVAATASRSLTNWSVFAGSPATTQPPGALAPEHKVVEYAVGTYEEITPGIFHKLTGALTSKGLQILSAEIHTLAHNLVLDRFYVQDMDYAAEPPRSDWMKSAARWCRR